MKLLKAFAYSLNGTAGSTTVSPLILRLANSVQHYSKIPSWMTPFRIAYSLHPTHLAPLLLAINLSIRGKCEGSGRACVSSSHF